MNEEDYLITQIAIIEEKYRRLIEPLVDRLFQIRDGQLPPYVVRAATYKEVLARQTLQTPLSQSEATNND